MRIVAKNIICHSLVLLLVIQIVNLSINSFEFYAHPSTIMVGNDEDYIDSMAEYLLENVLGMSKHTFHDRATGNNMAKLQQNVAHIDLATMRFPILLSYPESNQLKKTNMIAENQSEVSLYNREVLSQPPRPVLA